jgi:subtilase family serine protease
MVIEISGKARVVEKAFGVSFSMYQYQNLTFYSNTAEAQIPSNLGILVKSLVGLHNLTYVHVGATSFADPTYTPSNIRSAYDANYLIDNLGYTGAGQTIDILDAYDYPNLFSDLAAFDTAYSLPGPPSISKVTINSPSTCPSSGYYCLETALDTEWAHAMAPGATIHVTLVPDLSDNSLISGIQYVINYDLTSGGIFSNSWAGPEMCSFLGVQYQCDPSFVNSVHPLLVQAASQGISTFFSSGDSGAYDAGVLTTEYPASDPYVTGVGGTSLNTLSPSETAWSGSGGGYSAIFSEPSYQSLHFSLPGRGVPDVSMDADPATGVYVYCNQPPACSGFYSGVGGTSLSAPLWAGSVALLNQAIGSNFGFLNPTLYNVIYPSSEYSSDFHDITSGSNGYYSAGTGWDAITGLGTPDLLKMAQNRVMTKTVTLTQTSKTTATSYSYGTTTTTVTSYTGTSTSTSTIPSVTTVVLVPLTVTLTMQNTQVLTSITTTTVTSYTSTETSTSTTPTITTVVLIPLTVTSAAQNTQCFTSTIATTVTSYTSTETSTSTIPVVTTVTVAPSTTTSTVQSTQVLTSMGTTTVTAYTTATATSYTSTTTSTGTSIVYTTVTTSGAAAGVSSSLMYLGFLSLLAFTVSRRVTTGRGLRIPKVLKRH